MLPQKILVILASIKNTIILFVCPSKTPKKNWKGASRSFPIFFRRAGGCTQAKILHKHCFDVSSSSLGTVVSPKRNKNNAHAKFWEGQTKSIMVFLILANLSRRLYFASVTTIALFTVSFSHLYYHVLLIYRGCEAISG